MANVKLTLPTLPKFLMIAILLFGFLSITCRSENSNLDYKKGVQKVADQKLWSQLEDILVLRRLGRTGPILQQSAGLHQELVKLYSFPTAVSTKNVSPQCVEDSLFYVNNLMLNGSDWAIRMFESSGQIPVSVLGEGNHHAEGMFDECLAVRSAPSKFRGKYCTVFFKLAPIVDSQIIQDAESSIENQSGSVVLYVLRQLFGSSAGNRRVEPKLFNPETITIFHNYPSLSICLPSSCSASDLAQSVSQLVGSYVIGDKSIVTITDDDSCFTDDVADLPPVDSLVIAYVSILGVILFVILLATSHEAWRMYDGKSFDAERDGKLVTGLHCFSVLNNGRKLLSLSQTSSDDLSCIHGIRFLSTCWIIVAHSALKISSSGKPFILNSSAMHQATVKDWFLLIISNPSVGVDSFFLISGLLVSYLLLKEFDKTGGKINYVILFIKRYFRLTPVYALMVGFVATLAKYLGSGPYWYTITMGTQGCRENWWKNMLYINNLFPVNLNSVCMPDAWYLAVDMQMFLIAPLFIYLLWRFKNTGILALLVATVASIIISAVVFIVYDLPPTIMTTRVQEIIDDFVSYVDNVYCQPWIRAPPYLIGLLTGWFIYRNRKSKLQLSSWMVTLFWTLSSMTMTAIVLGLYPYLDELEVPKINIFVTVLYGAFHRAAWALAVAWMIIACMHGYGGIINHILSWKGFLPGSRLTYCAYLVGFGHINIFYAMNRRMIYYTFLSQLTTYLGIICYTFAVAFFLGVFFEASFLSFMKFIFDLCTSSEDLSSVESDQESDTTKSTVSTTSSRNSKEKMDGSYLSPNFTKSKNTSRKGKRSGVKL